MVVLEREALERLPDLGSLCFRFVSVFSWKKCEREGSSEVMEKNGKRKNVMR